MARKDLRWVIPRRILLSVRMMTMRREVQVDGAYLDIIDLHIVDEVRHPQLTRYTPVIDTRIPKLVRHPRLALAQSPLLVITKEVSKSSLLHLHLIY